MVRLSKKITKPRFLIVATISLVIVGVLAFLFFHDSKNSGSGTIPSTTTGPPATAKTGSANDKQTSPSTSSSDTSDKDNSSTNTNTSGGLTKPYGSFVSNHHPNLSGSPAPSQMQSVCNTTPGATCSIFFTKEGVVKTLIPQTVDSNGATYWTWDVNDAGLSGGQWQITAKATLGSGSESSTDSQFLEVGP